MIYRVASEVLFWAAVFTAASKDLYKNSGDGLWVYLLVGAVYFRCNAIQRVVDDLNEQQGKSRDD